MKSLYLPINERKQPGLYEVTTPEENDIICGIIKYLTGHRLSINDYDYEPTEKNIVCCFDGNEVSIHVPITDMTMPWDTEPEGEQKIGIGFGDIVVDSDDPALNPVKEISNTLVYVPMNRYNEDLVFIPRDRFYTAKEKA